MKPCLTKTVLISLVATALIGCTQQEEQPQQQSALVTAANETAAISRLRGIAAAEARYGVESGGEYGTLDQLIEKRYLRDPSEGKLSGYRFEIRVKSGGFQVTAVPIKFGVTGNRSFYLDETNTIRASDRKGEPATEFDPAV